jgi:hypothetical protein
MAFAGVEFLVEPAAAIGQGSPPSAALRSPHGLAEVIAGRM